MRKSYNRRKFIRTAAIASIGMGIGSHFYCNPKNKTKVAAGGRIGIIGLDTSHSIAFTKIFNETRTTDELGGYRVVAAYPTKGSPDIESSISRLAGFTKEMQDLGVPLVSSIEELIDKTDVILLETNDGRLHLEQALPVLKAGKKLFIDKPLASSLESVLAIFEAAKKYNTPVFSSSSLRYFENIQDIIPEKMGKITGAETFSPATLEKAHSDLFWYGIHGVEMLYTVLGANCKNVSRIFTEGTDIVTGHWDDNRIGSFRGLRTGKMDYGGIVFGEKDIVTIKPGKDYGYRTMMMKTVEFFQTGKPPVTPEETIGIYTFMAAAEESSRNNGILVSIENTLKKASQIINN